jgi:hypothetical protein
MERLQTAALINLETHAGNGISLSFSLEFSRQLRQWF